MTNKKFDIREIPSTDPANLLLSNYAFTSTPKVPDKEKEAEYLQQRSDDRIFHSFLNNESVAKVGVIPMTQNVRGKVMPMGGITGVASMPVARRGGHIRALMNHSIEVMHADGQAVSSLYPFKTSYYEKFGYAGWQVPLWVRITPAALAPYLRVPKHGTVKHRLTSDVKDEVYAFLKKNQADVHGMSCQPRVRFDNGAERYPTWFMSVHEGDEITGGICYKLDLDKQIMETPEVYWSTNNGKLQVLDFMARHVDQVKQIRMPLREGQHPHMWFTDDGETTILSNEDYSWGPPMARIVTIAGLNGIPVGDAEATITVQDEQAPWNNGIWTFSGKEGQLSVREGGTPGGDLTINGLSAIIFSGLEAETLPYRGWGSVDAETASALQRLFPQVKPHLHELF